MLTALSAHDRRILGRGWHCRQLKLDRFMNDSRWIGVPQRGQGRSAWP
jgi:hypothetical protein